jgi:hypothetical protein
MLSLEGGALGLRERCGLEEVFYLDEAVGCRLLTRSDRGEVQAETVGHDPDALVRAGDSAVGSGDREVRLRTYWTWLRSWGDQPRGAPAENDSQKSVQMVII